MHEADLTLPCGEWGGDPGPREETSRHLPRDYSVVVRMQGLKVNLDG